MAGEPVVHIAVPVSWVSLSLSFPLEESGRLLVAIVVRPRDSIGVGLVHLVHFVDLVHLVHVVHLHHVHVVHLVHVVDLVHLVHVIHLVHVAAHHGVLVVHVLSVVRAVEVISVQESRVSLGIGLGVGIPLPVAVTSVVETSPVGATITLIAQVAIVCRAASPVVAVPVGGISFGLGFRLSGGNSRESENYELEKAGLFEESYSFKTSWIDSTYKFHDDYGFNKKLDA